MRSSLNATCCPDYCCGDLAALFKSKDKVLPENTRGDRRVFEMQDLRDGREGRGDNRDGIMPAQVVLVDELSVISAASSSSCRSSAHKFLCTCIKCTLPNLNDSRNSKRRRKAYSGSSSLCFNDVNFPIDLN